MAIKTLQNERRERKKNGKGKTIKKFSSFPDREVHSLSEAFVSGTVGTQTKNMAKSKYREGEEKEEK